MELAATVAAGLLLVALIGAALSLYTPDKPRAGRRARTWRLAGRRGWRREGGVTGAVTPALLPYCLTILLSAGLFFRTKGAARALALGV